jgi:hypothetical protein
MTTIRATDCAREGDGKPDDAADAATPATTFLRVIRGTAFMSITRYGAAAIEAAAYCQANVMF